MAGKKLFLFVCFLMLVANGSAYAASGVEVNGDLTLSGTGGIVFPDGTVQTTASTSTPTWSQILASNRFVPVMGGAGQLDRETGLVWATAPDSTLRTWDDAMYYCYSLSLGGRGGWRLPSITELRSLVDPTRINPALPVGHPFSNVQSAVYWSSTPYAPDTTAAWHVYMYNGYVGSSYKTTETFFVWPVRGGQ